MVFRDQSLFTGRGGYKAGEGGGREKFDPYERGGGQKALG